MTAMPCGQKNNRREMIQSQTVTPPLAAMLGTTLRLKTATTNSSTRSKRPRTRFKGGWLGSVLDIDEDRVIGSSIRTSIRTSRHRVIGFRWPDDPMVR